MKKLIVIIVTVGLIFTLVGCSGNTAQKGSLDEDAVLEGVLAEFNELAKIPRQSNHEQAVSDYLAGWAKNKGFEYVQDDLKNIIIEVPPTQGYENAPLTILQGHMDMVCVAKDGVAYDPLTDPIKVIRSEETLTADGTSLGADNGIGVAMAQYIITDQDVDHGPLRVIFTVNEEEGFTGALGIDAKYFQDATYLINCDSETFGEMTESCAGSNRYNFTRPNTWTAPTGDLAYKISLSGLLGGHSGMEIGLDHANAIKNVGDALSYVLRNGVNIELAAFDGGSASNAIPTSATATVVIAAADQQAFESLMAEMVNQFGQTYSKIEENYVFTYEKTDQPAKVLSEADEKSFLNLVAGIQDGIHTISQFADDLIESSTNLGLASIGETSTTLNTMARSSTDLHLTQYTLTYHSLAEMAGYNVELVLPNPGWPLEPDNPLRDLYAQTYKDDTGEDAKMIAIHAGLECGCFAGKNPELRMISVGPNLTDVHTPNETLYLDSIAPSVEVLANLLQDIK